MDLLLAALLFALLPPQDKVSEAVKKAQAKLETVPDDPEANQTMGKYLAFDKGEIEKGLPFLVKGSDVIVKPVAERDLAGAKEPGDMVKLGDAWLEVAEKRGNLKARCVERGFHWFQKAWPFVEGKEKDGLRRVFYRMSGPPAGYEKSKKSVPIAGWDATDMIGSFLEPAFGHGGRQSIKILQHPKNGEEAYTDSQQVPVLPGKKYVFSAWVYSDKTDTDGRMNVRVYDKANKVILEKNYQIPQDSPFWQRLDSEEIEFPPESHRAMCHFGTKATQGAIWIDDVTIVSAGKDYMKNGGIEGK